MYPTWDLATRLFHWLLVGAIFLSWLSHEYEWISVHLWSGYTVLVLVGFRLCWGFFGSAHSRFSDFLCSPRSLLQHWRGELSGQVGHNPVGGWSVVLMLALILAQALTGLFNSDGLLFDGPLYHALDSAWTDKLGELHEQLFWAILVVVCLHVLAVFYYQYFKGDKLLGPMVSGGAEGSAAPVSQWRALSLLLLCTALLALAVYLAPAPEVYW